MQNIHEALQEWTTRANKNVEFVMKGQCMLTEHYSALQAEVPLDEDEGTKLNVPLMDKLRKASKIICCGQAKSHCVNYTVRDLLQNLDPEDASKLVLLEDAMSSVSGFDTVSEDFIRFVKERGVQITSCDELILD